LPIRSVAEQDEGAGHEYQQCQSRQRPAERTISPAKNRPCALGVSGARGESRNGSRQQLRWSAFRFGFDGAKQCCGGCKIYSSARARRERRQERRPLRAGKTTVQVRGGARQSLGIILSGGGCLGSATRIFQGFSDIRGEPRPQTLGGTAVGAISRFVKQSFKLRA
jgi:hypothetical protein